MNIYKFRLSCKNKYWYLNDSYHRDYDRPSCIGSDGYKSWRKHDIPLIFRTKVGTIW